MRTASPLSSFLLAAALAACGSEPQQASSDGNAQGVAAQAESAACAVLTQADAAKALRHEVEKLPATGGAAGADICQYGWEGARIAETGNVGVIVHPLPLSDFRRSVADAGMKLETVGGLGDDAFWSEEAGLHVGKGGRTAIYTIGGAGISDNRAAAIELARATVGRL